MSPRPIFLVGCPRSGTTLLSAILHAHPDIAVAPETRFLLPAYRRRREFGDLESPDARRKLAVFMTRRKSLFADLKISRKKVIAAAVAAPPTFGSVVSCVWREFAADRGATRWVEKRPAYWREVATVLRLFPNAQIIHLVRDPRSVTASLTQMRWFRDSVPNATALWVQADRELRKWGRRLPADSYHRLRYEDLLGDPQGELARLCTFIDEPFADAMLDHASAAADLVPERKIWHDRVRGPIDPSRLSAWQNVLTPRDAGLVEVGARSAMERNGYEPSDVATRPSGAALVAFEGWLAGMRFNMIKDRAEDALLRRQFPVPLAAVDA